MDPITLALTGAIMSGIGSVLSRMDKKKKAQVVNDLVQESTPTVRLVERGREEEKLGDDPPVRYDNRSSTLEQHYTLTASREWRHEVKVGTERLRGQQTTGGGELSTPPLSLKLEKSINETLKKSYSISVGKVEKFQQTIDLRVPARTLVLITLQWKRIWQVGEILVETRHGSIKVPFSSLAGVAFDVHTETKPAAQNRGVHGS
jgi:hypothetical protein